MQTKKELEKIYQQANKKMQQKLQYKKETKYQCESCGKTMSLIYFYEFKDGTYSHICKRCETWKLDNSFPEDKEIVLSLCKKYDIPFIKEDYKVLEQRELNKKNINPNIPKKSVFGKYLSKMKLYGFRNYTFSDSEKLNELRNN